MIVRTKANSLLEQLIKTTSSGITNYYYIGLHSYTRYNRNPLPDGSQFDEPVIPDGTVDDDGKLITVNEYQRVSLKDLMEEAKDGMIKNSSIIFFNEAEHYGWGQITHFGIFTQKTGGTPIFYGELTNPVEIPQYYIPIFRAKKLQIGLDQDPANPVVAPYDGTVTVT